MDERDIEKRDGIVRDRGTAAADKPSDRPENGDALPHPQDVNELHGDVERDEAESDEEIGPTGSTPR
jgi:hypothetical protein